MVSVSKPIELFTKPLCPRPVINMNERYKSCIVNGKTACTMLLYSVFSPELEQIVPIMAL